MNYRRALLLLALAAASILLVIYWRDVLAFVIGISALKIIAHKLGLRSRRPKSSWSSLGRTGAMMFAAWNSRWLKPATVKASIPEKGQPTVEDFAEVPF